MFTEYHLYTILATGKRMCASKSKWYFHSKSRTPGKCINHVVGLTHYSPGAIRFQNCLPFVPSNILYRDQTRLCTLSSCTQLMIFVFGKKNRGSSTTRHRQNVSSPASICVSLTWNTTRGGGGGDTLHRYDSHTTRTETHWHAREYGTRLTRKRRP